MSELQPWLKGYVFSEITQNLAVDRERLTLDLAEDLESSFAGEAVAVKHISRAIDHLEKEGFIEVEENGNITQDEPSVALHDLKRK